MCESSLWRRHMGTDMLCAGWLFAISSVLYVHPQFDTSGNPQQCPTYLGGALTVPLQPGSGNPMFDQVAVNPLNDDY